MNTINNTFSFSRFGAVLKRDLVENRKRYIAVFFLMFVAFLVSQLSHMASLIDTFHRHSSIHPDQLMPSLATNFTPFFMGVLVLALCCAAADMCGVPMGSKGRATNYMMMPAANLEKFLSRVFVNVAMVIGAAFVALLLADLVRMLFVPLFEVKEFYGFTVHKVFAEVFDDFVELYHMAGEMWGTTADGTIRIVGFNPFYGFMTATAVSLYLIFAHSVFLLGGCFWRKGAIVKTLFVGFVLFAAIVWIFVMVESDLISWVNEVIAPLFETEQKAEMTLIGIAIPVLLALIIFNWWLSFRLFSRKQVVARTHLFGGKHPHHLFKKAHS